MASRAPIPVEELLSHEEFVRVIARRLLRHEDRVDDVVQDAWLAAIHPSAKSQRRHSLRAWLAGVAHRSSLMRLRSDRNRVRREEAASADEVVPSAEEVWAREALRRSVVEEVLALPAEIRDCVLLRFFEGKTARDSARLLGVSTITVRRRLTRGLTTLRQRLDVDEDQERRRTLALVALSGARVGNGSPLPIVGAILLLATALSEMGWWSATDDQDSHPSIENPTPLSNSLASVDQETGELPSNKRRALAPRSLNSTTLIRGRVITEDRVAIEGASVTFISAEGDRFRGRVEGSDFAVTVPEHRLPSLAWLHVSSESRAIVHPVSFGRDPRFHVMHKSTYDFAMPIGSPEFDVGPIVLRRSVGVRVRLMEGGTELKHHTVTLECGFGAYSIAEATTDDRGLVEFNGVPIGPAAIDVEERGRYPLRTTENVQLIDVTSIQSVVRVIDRTTKKSIEGAKVVFHEVLCPWEDVRRGEIVEGCVRRTRRHPWKGQTHHGIVRLPPLAPSTLVEISVSAPGYDRGVIAASIESELQIELVESREREVEIRSAEGHPLADGSAIRIHSTQDRFPDFVVYTQTGKIAIPSSVLDPETVLIGPDGTRGGVPTKHHPRSRTVTLGQPRNVTVVVTDRNGNLLANHWVVVSNPDRSIHHQSKATETNGTCEFVGVDPGPIRVDVFDGNLLVDSRLVETGKDVEETILKPEIDALALSFRLGNEPFLPPFFQIRIDERTALIDREDPDSATLFVPIPRKTRPQQITLETLEYGTVKASLPPGEKALDVVLRGTSSIACRVLQPADGSESIGLKVKRGVDWYWHADESSVRDENEIRFDGLVPGSYRVVDRLSGLSTDVLVVESGVCLRSSLDLSAAGWIQGRMEAPSGFDVSKTILRIRAMAADSRIDSSDFLVLPDGRFRVRVPGSHDCRLQVRHPVLVADPNQSITIRDAREGLLIRLVRGRVVSLEPYPELSGPFEVRIFEETTAERPSLQHWLESRDGLVTFGVGSLESPTIWICPPRHAPLLIHDVALDEGEARLGRLMFSKGATLRLTSSKTSIPMWCRARCLDPPQYERSVRMVGRSCVLEGLSQGTFEVEVHLGEPPRPVLQETITLDGSEVLTWNLDQETQLERSIK